MTNQPLQPETHHIKLAKTVTLESGAKLSSVTVCFTTWGKREVNDTNIVWIFHALTGNSNPADWWPGLFGEEAALNPENQFIICANSLGSCYGTTCEPKLSDGLLTIQDMVQVHKLLRDFLSIQRVKIGIGGSIGGQQLLQWAVDEPHFFESIIPIATNARHSPWGIAFNETQRMALENKDKEKGLETARAIAMLSYRSYKAYDSTQKEKDNRSDHFSASSYQRYQGEKLKKRFTPEAYFLLSKAMDSHNLARKGSSMEDCLKKIKSKTLVIGIDSDLLFPVEEQRFLAENINEAELAIIKSQFGHDAFLIELDQLNKFITDFILRQFHEF